MNSLTRIFSCILLAVLGLGLVAGVSAQSAPELLPLLPDDFGICVVMRDLRGQANRWEQSGWLRTFRKSLVGKSLLEAPELKLLAQWEKQLQKHLELDWPSLRDDILGDHVVFAYSASADNKPDDERGLLLVSARKPERLQSVIARLKDANRKSTSPAVSQYKGITYYRRKQGKDSQFFLLDGALLAISSREDVLHGVIDKKLRSVKDTRWITRFQKAGAEQAFITLCINPKSLAPEFVNGGKKDGKLPGYWQALEGIFVSLSIQDDTALQISIQADVGQLPAWGRQAFTQNVAPSALWQRFPRRSVFTLATKVDFSRLAETALLLMVEKERKHSGADAQLGLDLVKGLLPNVGTDWGVCVLPANQPQQLPQALIAVAVRSDPRDPPIDQSLFKALQFLTSLALAEYNKTHPETIRLQMAKQDAIDVMYLTGDRVFPGGTQPACALKDGFLLLASSPEAILDFRLHESKSGDRNDTLLLRLSTPELARLLGQRQETILENLRKRHHLSEEDVRRNLASVISLLEQFDQVSLSHRASTGQANWMLRLTPARPKSAKD